MKHSAQARVRTAAQAKAWLTEEGYSITEWARENGFKRAVVSAVLRGLLEGRYGEAHKVMVALGMKNGVIRNTKGPQSNGHHA